MTIMTGPRRSTRLAAQSKASKTSKTKASPPTTTTATASSTPLIKRKSTRSTVSKSIKKRKIGLRNAINVSKSLGIVDPESGINGTILDINNAPCDVMLVLVDPAKHMDKFFVLQLIESMNNTFYVYTRWGRTGTSGQALEQKFQNEEDAEECFRKKFHEKTGLEWEMRNDPTVGHKYRYIRQNFTEKKSGYTSAKWQYWVDDHVDGKVDGWYNYSDTGSQQVERLYQESSINPRLTNRLVDSGTWTYDVNLTAMTQTNVKHPNKTTRRIRRCTSDGKKMDKNPPAPISVCSTPVPVTSTTIQSLPIVTPSITPVLPVSLSSSLPTQTHSNNNNNDDDDNDNDQAPPVDQDIDLFSTINTSKSYNVVKDTNGEWYDVVLNQCNITYGNNNNKYYRMQLIQHKISKGFYVWMKWGRVGETPKANTKNLKGPFTTENKAFNIFAKKYSDKTGNRWGDAEFVPRTNKYTRIEIDNNVEVNDELKTNHVKKEQIEYLPSDLDSKTKELIEILFSKDMRDEALSTFNLDLKRLPLGVPSQQQIEVGISILNEIEDKINGGGSRRSISFDELSSQFYTAIPHSFGRQRPPVINTTTSLQQRYDMCNILMDMYSTNETIRKLEEEEAKIDVKKVPSPVDSHYKSLNADLSVMKKNTDEFQKIQKYFDHTKGSHSNAKLIDAWKVDRHGEDERFKKFDEVDNRKLLWHGTNIAVVAPILTSGLRIMPHSGGRVGAGIYLASMQEKSAQYTSGYGSKFACMFLCEAPLGKSHQITSDGYHASSLKKAPNGYDSVHAIGMTAPKSWGSISLDGNDVNVPDSNAIQTDVKSSFWHDEYLVYDESQVRIRYVLTVKLY